MATTDTTQKGVSGTTTNDDGNKDVHGKDDTLELIPEDGPSLDPEVKRDRDDVMSDIVARREAQLKAESAESVPVQEPAAPTPAEPVAAEPVAAEPISIKVDGEEREVTPQDIIDYQKHKAADQRLREAAETRARLVKREQDLKQREALLAQQAVQAPESNDEDLDDLADQLIDGTFSEDRNAIKKVLVKLRSNQAAPQPVMAPVITEEDIDKRIALRDQRMEHKRMLNKFAKVYPELNANSALLNSVDARTVIERQKDPTSSDWDIIDRSAKHVKAEIKKALGVEMDAPAVDAEIQQRIDRKKSMGTPVVPTAKATAPLNDSQGGEELTAFQIIQQARGQG